MATAGPSRPPAIQSHFNPRKRGPDSWHPSAYLEPNHPDAEEVEEQASYRAALTKGNDRKARYKPRKTVDYQGGVVKWRQLVKMKGGTKLPSMHPNPSDLVGLLPAAAHAFNPSTSVLDQFMHTSINKEKSSPRVVSWTPDSQRCLTGNDKGQFTLWNGRSFNYESITQVHDDSIRAMAWSHNGQSLISCDKVGMIKYFTPHLTNVNGFQGHREACHGVSWSPNDERFVTGGDDGLVKVWSYREAREEKALSGHGWDVRCVDWHPTKGLIVSGSRDMLVKFWDPRTGKDLSTLHSHKNSVNTCKWSPSGHLVATAGGDSHIRLFDIRTFRELDVLKAHQKEVNTIEFHPIHPQIFSSADGAGTICHWSLLSPDISVPVTKLVSAHDDAIFSLSYHPLGHLLCSGSKDFTARFWARPRPMGGHEIDKYHLGEQGMMEAKWEARKATAAAAAAVSMNNGMGNGEGETDGNKTNGGLPGLPGLSGAGLQNLVGSLGNVGVKQEIKNEAFGGGGLPGFGGNMSNGYNNPTPPVRAWGGAAPAGPLPSQAELMRQGRSDPPRERAWGGGDNGRERPPSNSYSDRSGGYGSQPPPQSFGYGPPDQGTPQGGMNGYPPQGGQGRMPPPQGYPQQNYPPPRDQNYGGRNW